MPERSGVALPSKYRIFETEEYIKRLAKIGKRDRDFIASKVQGYIFPQLRQEPHFGKNIKKLRQYLPDTWRYRIGQFRLFYIIDESEHVVSIIAVEYRQDAY